MVNKGRTDRGRETEFLLAEYLKSLYPDACATNKSAPGMDVANCGVLDIEAKATAALPLLSALSQVHRRVDSNQIPVVIWRPNGYGKERIREWVVATRLSTFFGPIAERANYFR
jgi:hypothetical protein